MIKCEVLDATLDGGGGFGDAVLQAGSVADLVEKDERHLIVAAPGNIRERIVYDGRHDVNVLTEHGGGVDGERGSGFIARQRLDGVVVEFGKRKVHN